MVVVVTDDFFGFSRLSVGRVWPGAGLVDGRDSELVQFGVIESGGGKLQLHQSFLGGLLPRHGALGPVLQHVAGDRRSAVVVRRSPRHRDGTVFHLGQLRHSRLVWNRCTTTYPTQRLQTAGLGFKLRW